MSGLFDMIIESEIKYIKNGFRVVERIYGEHEENTEFYNNEIKELETMKKIKISDKEFLEIFNSCIKERQRAAIKYYIFLKRSDKNFLKECLDKYKIKECTFRKSMEKGRSKCIGSVVRHKNTKNIKYFL